MYSISEFGAITTTATLCAMLYFVFSRIAFLSYRNYIFANLNEAKTEFESRAEKKYNEIIQKELSINDKIKNFNENKYVLRFNHRSGDKVEQETIFVTCDKIDFTSPTSIKRGLATIQKWLKHETAKEVIKVLPLKQISSLPTIDANEAFLLKEADQDTEQTQPDTPYTYSYRLGAN